MITTGLQNRVAALANSIKALPVDAHMSFVKSLSGLVEDAYNEGYDEGTAAGYDEGWDEGYSDGQDDATSNDAGIENPGKDS